MCQPLFYASAYNDFFAVVFRLKETGQDNTFFLVENNMEQSGNVTLLPWMCVKIPAGCRCCEIAIVLLRHTTLTGISVA